MFIYIYIYVCLVVIHKLNYNLIGATKHVWYYIYKLQTSGSSYALNIRFNNFVDMLLFYKIGVIIILN